MLFDPNMSKCLGVGQEGGAVNDSASMFVTLLNVIITYCREPFPKVGFEGAQ